MSPIKAGSEAAFQTQVLNLAGYYGWRSYHTHDSRRSQAGFPDLVLVRGAELIFAELKTDTGRLRPEQQEWIAALKHVGRNYRHAIELLEDDVADGAHDPTDGCVDVYLWRPRDFDVLHARLARGRHRSEPLHNPARDAA